MTKKKREMSKRSDGPAGYSLKFRVQRSLEEECVYVQNLDLLSDQKKNEYSCRVVYIDSTRLKGKDIILAKEPENLYCPPSKPIVECDWTLEMKIYHSDS